MEREKLRMESTKEYRLKVLMLPWLAHGHTTSFLELAKALSSRNILCYICSTPVIVDSIKSKIIPEKGMNIRLVELHLPSSPDLPPERHTTKGLRLGLHQTLVKALTMARPDFLKIVENLQFDVLIHDMLHPWAAQVASIQRIPAACLNTSSAIMLSYMWHLITCPPGVEFPFPAIYLNSFELSMLLCSDELTPPPPPQGDGPPPDGIDLTLKDVRVVFMSSSREMEGKYMDYASQLMNKRIVPIGALLHDHPINTDDTDDDDEDKIIMDWLDEKDDFSSVFVSFGSESFPKRQDIEELAYGLEMSNVNFIWVIRIPKGEDLPVPEGFLERVGKRGMIVHNWAPQAKILRHASIGGFVSHCGWNSIKESIDLGVPIIAMPVQTDQLLNAKLVVELGVGVELKRDGQGRLRREEISQVIKDVVFGETGHDLRRSVRDKSDCIRATSRQELEGFVQELLHLSCDNI